MGVRGKLEAVIYAAEEPVTLQQMVALFGEEALAEQGVSAQAEQLPLLSDGEIGGEVSAEASGELSAELPAAAAEQDPPAETEADQPAEAEKRAARSREREAREAIRVLLKELAEAYDSADRGMEIREIAGGYRIATKPEYHDAVRAFAKSLKPPMKLSLQALETLAVIAYKQPVTAPEVSEIRGVDSGGVLGSLISRKLVTTAGRKQVVGRPILYKTTKEFLLRFGLKDIAELPSMEEFEKMAGELTSLVEEQLPAAGEVEAPPATEAERDDGLPRERPILAPSPISVSVEEPEPSGIAVNRSGIAVVQGAPGQKLVEQQQDVPVPTPAARQETT